MNKSHIRLIALAVLLASGNAQAAFDVNLEINQLDASGASVSAWNENITNLVSPAADGGFSMLTSASPGAAAYFQNGSFMSSVPSQSAHPDYWSWMPDAAAANGGYWNWHSAETVSGAIRPAATGPDPWKSVFNLNNAQGHKIENVDYDYFARNNTGHTQTYTFSVVEDIKPAVGNLNSVFNQFKATFANNSGNFLFNPTNSTGAQQLLLSSDGINWVDAGVDVGSAYSNPTTLAVFESKSATGPGVGGPWSFMKLQVSFSLSALDRANVSGIASISAVPESDVLPMMLAGFSLISFVAARRKRNQNK